MLKRPYQLTVITNLGRKVHKVARDEITIGRDGLADILISHNSVSRKHLQVRRSGDKFLVSDLGSSNGSSINGTDLKPNTFVEISARTMIDLGNSGVQVLIEELRQEEKPTSLPKTENANAPVNPPPSTLAPVIKEVPAQLSRSLAQKSAPATPRKAEMPIEISLAEISADAPPATPLPLAESPEDVPELSINLNLSTHEPAPIKEVPSYSVVKNISLPTDSIPKEAPSFSLLKEINTSQVSEAPPKPNVHAGTPLEPFSPEEPLKTKGEQIPSPETSSAESNAAMETKRAELQKLESQLHALRKEVANETEKAETLRKNVGELEQSRNRLFEESEELRRTMDERMVDLQRTELNQKTAESSAKNCMDRQSSLEAEEKNLRAKLDQIQQQLLEASQEYTQITEAISKNQTILKEFERQKIEHDARIILSENLKKELLTTEKNQLALEQDINKKRSLLEDTTHNLKQQNERLSSTQSQILQKETELQKISLKIEESLRTYGEMEAQIRNRDVLEKQLSDLQASIHENIKLSSQLNEKVTERQARAHQLEQELIANETKRQTMSELCKELEQKVHELRESLSDLEVHEKEHAELMEQNTILNRQIADNKKLSITLEGEVITKRNMLESAIEKEKNAQANLDSIKIRCREAESRLSRTLEAISISEKDLAQLRNQLELTESKNTRTREQANTETIRLETIQKSLSEVESARSNAQEQLEFLRSEIGQQKTVMARYEAERDSARTLALETQKELESLQQRLNDWKQDSQNHHQELAEFEAKKAQLENEYKLLEQKKLEQMGETEALKKESETATQTMQQSFQAKKAAEDAVQMALMKKAELEVEIAKYKTTQERFDSEYRTLKAELQQKIEQERSAAKKALSEELEIAQKESELQLQQIKKAGEGTFKGSKNQLAISVARMVTDMVRADYRPENPENGFGKLEKNVYDGILHVLAKQEAKSAHPQDSKSAAPVTDPTHPQPHHYDEEGEQKMVWMRAGLIAAGLCIATLSVLLLRSYSQNAMPKPQRAITSQPSGESDKTPRAENNSKFKPITDRVFRDSYTENLINTEGYSKMKSDPTLQKKWEYQLKDHFSKTPNYDERKVLLFVSAENLLIRELSLRAEKLTAQNQEYEMRKMQNLENNELQKISEIVGGRENLHRIQQLEKTFYEDHLKR